MIATFINCITVIIGSLLGLLIRSRITKDFKNIVETAAGFVCLVIGLDMALKTNSALVLLFALLIGGIIGTALKIDYGILHLGKILESKTKGTCKEGSTFAAGFLNASVLFCFGTMAVLGSIQAGLDKNYSLLLLKSGLDGSMAIVLAATYGGGVMASALFILIFQGAITLSSSFLSPYLTNSGIVELSAVGGIMIMMISFNLLRIKDIKTANYSPAIILAPIFIALQPFLANIIS
jgi:hypothetical protein